MERAFGWQPFHTSEARLLGVSDDRIERACAAGALQRLGGGWYAVASRELPFLARLRVLQDANPGLVACGETAAAIWGLPLPPGRGGSSGCLEVAFREGAGGLRGQRLGAVARRWRLPEHHIAQDLDGHAVTDPLRTAIDLARGLPLPFALISLDAGVRVATELGLDPGNARALLHRHWMDVRRSWGMRAVGLALPHADHRAESPLESIVRGRMIEAGLPTPDLQVNVMGASGRWYRSDMGLDLPGEPPESYGLLIEADGLLKYQVPQDLAGEKKRQHDLERRGHRFVRVLYSEAVHAPGAFLRDITRWVGR